MILNPQHLYDLVAPELAQVEEELRGYTRSNVRTISEIGEYVLKGGGKRIRPMLLLLTARMLGRSLRPRFGWLQWSSSSTTPPWFTTTSSMLPIHGEDVLLRIRRGEIP